jgi:hypothetical protein
MNFRTAVARTSSLGADRYHPGLQALGRYSDKVRCRRDRDCFTGSVDLNEVFPNSPWDYGIGFLEGMQEVALWIEPHPAYTSEVAIFLKKLTWLKDWLRAEATELWKLTQKSSEPYRWLATGGVHIAKNSHQARRLQEAGVSFPREVIELG